MPSLSMYKISAPSDAKEFENMVLDYAIYTYSKRSTLLGRQGQSQHGIDIIVTCEDNTKICIQCKNIPNKRITKTNIEQWIEEAKSSPIKITLFVIALACERDSILQEYVEKKSEERKNSGLYPVDIVFWDDIEHFIKSDKEVLEKYYPFLNYEINKSDENTNDSYPELIKDEISLKFSFINAYVKYKVQDIINADIFVGIPIDFIVSYDLFEAEMDEIINKAIVINNTQTYNNILKFLNLLKDYIVYLSTLVEYVNGNFFRVVDVKVRDEHEIYKAIIGTLKYPIVELFNSINIYDNY